MQAKTQKQNGHNERFGGDEYVYYSHCGNGVMSVWICTQTVHTKLVQFLIFQQHLSKTIFELPGRH